MKPAWTCDELTPSPGNYIEALGQQRRGKPATLAPEQRAVVAPRTQAVLGPLGDLPPPTLTAASDEGQLKVNEDNAALQVGKLRVCVPVSTGHPPSEALTRMGIAQPAHCLPLG